VDDTTKMPKPTVPEVLPLVHAFYAKRGNWMGGTLHDVLHDGNVKAENVQACLELARATGDHDAAQLAVILLRMTITQRRKLCALRRESPNAMPSYLPSGNRRSWRSSMRASKPPLSMTTRGPLSILLWLLAGVSAIASTYGWLVWSVSGHPTLTALALGVIAGLIAAGAVVTARRLGPAPGAHSCHGS
jgi:hypothetical protein